MIDTISTPSTGDDAAYAGGRIIDVDRGSDVPYWLGLAIGFPVAFVVLIAIIILVIELGFEKHSVFAGTVIASIVGLAVLLVAGVMKHKTRRRVAWDEDVTDGELARKIMDGIAKPSLSWLLEAVIENLPVRGRVGFVIRCCPEELRTSVEPVTVHLEPLALDEADAATAAFAEVQHPGDTTPAGSLASPDADFEPTLSRRVRRNVRLAGRWWFFWSGLGIAVLVLAWVYGSGDVPWVGAFAVLYMFVNLFLHGAGSTGEHWFLVPGGLVVRAWCRRSEDSAIYLYKRSQSLLIVTHLVKGSWSVVVGDGGAIHSRDATDAEVNLLLRCWLSPLKPPSVESYSDLGAPA